ncbi:MAG: rhodanese-like domain-containing protein [Desulfobacterales bacterium]|nr:rhodanese-like domain-containing protein [Desulfobacterales bacterium]
MKGLWQISLILAISAGLGIISNALRPDSLRLFGEWSSESGLTTPTGECLIISLSEAEKLFAENAAIFIDARSNEDFKKGHIPGAKSLPWQDVDRRFIEVIEDVSPDMIIITYCDGESCKPSYNLALFLFDMGFKNVRVLANGWSVWQEGKR